jgi:hypothetical protein
MFVYGRTAAGWAMKDQWQLNRCGRLMRILKLEAFPFYQQVTSQLPPLHSVQNEEALKENNPDARQ